MFSPCRAMGAAAIGDGLEDGYQRMGRGELGVIWELVEAGGVEIFEDGFGDDVVTVWIWVDAVA